MSDALSSAVSKLRASSARLNQLTDDAAATVKEVEEFLSQECSIGIPTYLCIHQATEEYEASRHLAYRRIGSTFRIALAWWRDGDPEDEFVKPWSDCSRDEKLESIKKLPDLLTEIARNVDHRIVASEKAVESVSQALQSLTGKED